MSPKMERLKVAEGPQSCSSTGRLECPFKVIVNLQTLKKTFKNPSKSEKIIVFVINSFK